MVASLKTYPSMGDSQGKMELIVQAHCTTCRRLGRLDNVSSKLSQFECLPGSLTCLRVSLSPVYYLCKLKQRDRVPLICFRNFLILLSLFLAFLLASLRILLSLLFTFTENFIHAYNVLIKSASHHVSLPATITKVAS